MAEDMVERVGAAIYDAEPDFSPALCRGLARLAIKAMREPTPKMAMEGLRVSLTSEMFGRQEYDARCLSEEERERIGFSDMLAGNPSKWERPIWRAMIDAALSDSTTDAIVGASNSR